MMMPSRRIFAGQNDTPGPTAAGSGTALPTTRPMTMAVMM